MRPHRTPTKVAPWLPPLTAAAAAQLAWLFLAVFSCSPTTLRGQRPLVASSLAFSSSSSSRRGSFARSAAQQPIVRSLAWGRERRRGRGASTAATATATAPCNSSSSARGDAFARPEELWPAATTTTTRRNNDPTEELGKYVLSLQRARRSMSNARNRTNTGAAATTDRPLCQPAYSLVGYLLSANAEAEGWLESEPKDRRPLLEDALSRSVVQGVRLASACNDYRLILKLVDATLQFAGSNAIIRPRIFGEAIDGLARTTASVGKIGRVWRVLDPGATHGVLVPAYLTAGPGPLEANSMLKALAGRGKVGAALKLFRDNCAANTGRTDSYSLTILLEGLASSIEDRGRGGGGDDDDDDDSPAPPPPRVNGTAESAPPKASLRRFRSWATSPCWQWNEAVSALDLALATPTRPQDRALLVPNNHVASALLKLNARAGEAFRDHDAAQRALDILDWMEDGSSSTSSSTKLDAVTCTLLLKGLRSRSKEAVALFRRMQFSSACSAQSEGLSFAAPNEYCYSAVIAACAKNREYEEALSLLGEFDAHPNSVANAHVYNSVLQALVTTTHPYRRLGQSRPTKRMRQEARHRWELAMHVFHEMNQSDRHAVRADSITYNTLLMILSGTVDVLGPSDWGLLQAPTARAVGASAVNRSEEWVDLLPQILISQMVDSRLDRDDMTYRHAFSACTTVRGLSCLVGHAISDKDAAVSPDALYSALPVAAHLGEFDGLCELLKRMPAPVDSKSISHVILSFGICQRTSLIPVVTRGISGDANAATYLEKELGRTIFAAGKHHQYRPDDIPRHFETAIQTCLRAKDVRSAGLVIAQAKDGDGSRRLTPAVFQEVGRMYALQGMSRRVDLGGVNGPESARKAYTVLQSVPNPPVSLMVLVAKSLAHTGSFDEAGDVLERIADHASTTRVKDDTRNVRLVQHLHKSLLSSCAARGNVTAALRFCECIQKSAFRGSKAANVARESSVDVSTAMNVAEWRLLLVAALKSGHWRVCLSTLQFLKPHVKALRPKLESATQLSQDNREYHELSSSLNLVTKCLALRGQYGWIVRVLNDWVAWSGRRPPKQSVFQAIRALCARGRGTEVGNLLAKCLTPKPLNDAREGSSYEIALAVFAVTSLYNEGLYDAADDVFITAIRSKTLSLNLREEGFSDSTKRRMTLDLHGMNLAVAHSAVRISLQQVARDGMAGDSGRLCCNENELVIVTGRGRTSALRMRPVLRPEVQRMLVEEFYPPLSSSSMPGNMGALRVPGEDIQVWLDNQRAAKRSRVMAVAALLKKISSNAMRAAVKISSSGAAGAQSSSE